MNRDESNLKSKLLARKEAGNLRQLKSTNPNLIDFSSNDYLGLSRNVRLKTSILNEYQNQDHSNGSTGSRLLTGNSALIEQTEAFLSNLFKSERALLFNSGYQANLAFFSTIPQRNDTILYDELSHACIKDGVRLSLAKKFSFRHNDIDQLHERLKRADPDKDIFVAIESVYSMDGDSAPISEMVDLCRSFGAKIVVDEAHSTGLWGEKGSGLVSELNLEKEVYARIMTFGKAMGVHGACVCGSELMIDYLINFSRPFIYTTAPSPFEIIAIRSSFEHLASSPNLAKDIRSKVELFRDQIDIEQDSLVESRSPIQIVKAPGNANAKALSQHLENSGFDVRPILSPTVEPGGERVRICLHAFNSESEIMDLCLSINNYFSN